MKRMDRSTITELQPIERDGLGLWRRMEGPLTGFRLKMNLPYVYRVGYSEAEDVLDATIAAMGYRGAIRLNKVALTYLYR